MRHEVKSIKTLIVSSDQELLGTATEQCCAAGYSPMIANNAEECFNLLQISLPEIVIMDTELPTISGLYVASMIRRNSNVPIIMVSSCIEERECVESLELGADDCVTKPLRPREFMLRVRNVLARHGKETHPGSALSAATCLPAVYKGAFIIDPNRHQLQVRGKNVRVSPLQFKFLHFIANHPDHVFSQDELLEEVWQEKCPHTKVRQDNVVVHIRELRKKIEEDAANPKHLLTSRGVGYQFRF